MKEATTYLMFDGNCREAMEFYAKCMGLEAQLMKYSDTPGQAPKDTPDRIMHARIGDGPKTFLMASDTQPGTGAKRSDDYSICIDCESQEETEKLFSAIGADGSVTMPLQDTFWGAYFGMVKDKFGVHWMFNYAKPQQ